MNTTSLIVNPHRALNEIQRAEFCAIVGIGCSRRCAADYLGVHLRTIRRMLARDDVFRAQLRKAETRPRARLVYDYAPAPKRGRPSVVDAEQRRTLLSILRMGCTRAGAAGFVGIAASTLCNLIQRDPEFRQAVFEAESHHEVAYKQRLEEATRDPRYWRAIAWSLERKFPQAYALQKPDMLTTAQLAEVLQKFGEIIADEVRDANISARIVVRLEELTGAMGRRAGLIGS